MGDSRKAVGFGAVYLRNCKLRGHRKFFSEIHVADKVLPHQHKLFGKIHVADNYYRADILFLHL